MITEPRKFQKARLLTKAGLREDPILSYSLNKALQLYERKPSSEKIVC